TTNDVLEEVVPESDPFVGKLLFITKREIGIHKVEFITITVDHARRLVDVLAHIIVVAAAGDLLDHLPEHQKSSVAVSPLGPWLERKLFISGQLQHVVHCAVECAGRLPELVVEVASKA